MPIIDSINFSLKHFREPWALIPLIMNSPARVKLRGAAHEKLLLQGRTDFWQIRNLVLYGWKIVDVKNGLIYLQKGDITIAGKLQNLGVIKEPLEEEYGVFDYKGKVVLDVGGYIGYSSVLFSKWGAKKIIVYEVQEELIPIINENFKLNRVNGEIYNVAIGDYDGYIEIPYTSLGTTVVGLAGDKKYRVRSIALSRILSKNHIDIAKFDCEGCEYALLSVPCELIRKVPKYVIEYHRGFEALKRKFERCGYDVKKLWTLDKKVGGFKAEVIL